MFPAVWAKNSKLGNQPVDFKVQAFANVVQPDAGPDRTVMTAVRFLFSPSKQIGANLGVLPQRLTQRLGPAWIKEYIASRFGIQKKAPCRGETVQYDNP
jgi:hypothetical protein